MMSLIKKCAVSGREFTVRDEDLAFYDKISPLIDGQKYPIPAPTLHPDERTRRRLAYRNERNLYKRKSSLSGGELVSVYRKDSPFPVYSHKEWWSDDWDPMAFGRDVDFNRPFFDQFHELQLAVPRPPLINNKSENSDFCNFSDGNKNCYLITSANRNEDSYYGFCLVEDKNAVDCLWCLNSEMLYECLDCSGCYNLRYCRNCSRCVDGAFLVDCRNLNNCLFCVNLRNKEFYIFNKPYPKEEYFRKAREMLSGSHSNYARLLKQFDELQKQYPVRKANNYVASENVEGENIHNSKNVFESFDVYDSIDIAYSRDGLSARDCRDIEFFEGTEKCYESTSLIGYGYRFTTFCRDSYDLFYCDNCHSCKNCFGCTGLRNKEFCIFNKQYDKAQYEKLAGRLITHMNSIGEWGEFFPVKYSMFAYNETLAQDYFPITKEEALKNGWQGREIDEKRYGAQKYPVPDSIKDVPDLILGQVLACEKCDKNYRIIPQELAFYRKMNLPVPRHCPDCRHMSRMQSRSHRRLFDRTCANCGEKVRTTYAPDRPETIYCEKCWLEAVY